MARLGYLHKDIAKPVRYVSDRPRATQFKDAVLITKLSLPAENLTAFKNEVVARSIGSWLERCKGCDFEKSSGQAIRAFRVSCDVS